jgi:hypothetical protein
VLARGGCASARRGGRSRRARAQTGRRGDTGPTPGRSHASGSGRWPAGQDRDNLAAGAVPTVVGRSPPAAQSFPRICPRLLALVRHWQVDAYHCHRVDVALAVREGSELLTVLDSIDLLPWDRDVVSDDRPPCPQCGSPTRPVFTAGPQDLPVETACDEGAILRACMNCGWNNVKHRLGSREEQ